MYGGIVYVEFSIGAKSKKQKSTPLLVYMAMWAHAGKEGWGVPRGVGMEEGRQMKAWRFCPSLGFFSSPPSRFALFTQTTHVERM